MFCVWRWRWRSTLAPGAGAEEERALCNTPNEACWPASSEFWAHAFSLRCRPFDRSSRPPLDLSTGRVDRDSTSRPVESTWSRIPSTGRESASMRERQIERSLNGRVDPVEISCDFSTGRLDRHSISRPVDSTRARFLDRSTRPESNNSTGRGDDSTSIRGRSVCCGA